MAERSFPAVSCHECGHQIPLEEFRPWPGLVGIRYAVCPSCASVQSVGERRAEG